MATWGQAFGKTLLQMAPDVQKKMQTNFEDRRNADVMREIARIALMTDPAQQQAEIQRMMTDPNTPREIMQYLPKVAEASAAAVRRQQESEAVARGVGFTGNPAGLDAQTILAMQQHNLLRDRALAEEKAREITRAREEAMWSQRQEAQKWLNSEEGRRTAELAASTVRDDRTGSVAPAPGAVAAQILYTQKWREAGYTGNPPFQEPHYFPPRSGGGTRDTTMSTISKLMELRNDIWDNLGMTEEQKAAAVAPIDAKLAALGFRIAPPAGGGITAALILDDARRSNPSADNASLVAWIRDQYRGATPEEMVEVTKAIESLSGQTQEAPTATPAPKAAAIVPRRSNRVDLTTYNPFSDMAALLPGMKRGLEIWYAN